MNTLWDLYWPAIAVALVIGVIAGAIAFRPPFRRKRRAIALVAGIAAVLVVAGLWHGPARAGERLTLQAEQQARETLDAFEMTQVRAKLKRAPLTRTLILAGPADDFQRSELVRIMDEVPGVANVRWTDGRAPATLPLLAEAGLAALVGFGLGLLLSYLIELRRRSRAEWRW